MIQPKTLKYFEKDGSKYFDFKVKENVYHIVHACERTSAYVSSFMQST